MFASCMRRAVNQIFNLTEEDGNRLVPSPSWCWWGGGGKMGRWGMDGGRGVGWSNISKVTCFGKVCASRSEGPRGGLEKDALVEHSAPFVLGRSLKLIQRYCGPWW